MKNSLRPALLAAAAALPLAACPALAAKAPAYHLVKKISLPGTDGWDYLTADSANHRLYVSRGSHVAVVDTAAGTVVGDIPGTAGVHGIAIDDADGRGFTSNGRANSVTIFDLKTLQKIGSDVPVGSNPDCIIYDAATKRVFTFNGGSNDATAVDALSGHVLGTIPLGGRPEYAVADGKGHVYDNIEDKSQVVAIDAKALKVDNTWSIAPGDGPSGISMDTKNRRLFSVCSNNKMTVLDADTGKLVATPTIGGGPDASNFDPSYGVAFSPNGDDGTLNVVQAAAPDQYAVVATVPTQSGARTMTLDAKTHHLFLVTASRAPAAPGAAPGQRRGRSYAEGSFVILEYAP